MVLDLILMILITAAKVQHMIQMIHKEDLEDLVPNLIPMILTTAGGLDMIQMIPMVAGRDLNMIPMIHMEEEDPNLVKMIQIL